MHGNILNTDLIILQSLVYSIVGLNRLCCHCCFESHKYIIWEIGDKLGLKYTGFEVPPGRNAQMLIENTKFGQFREEVGTGDRDFSGRTVCMRSFWLCNIL